MDPETILLYTHPPIAIICYFVVFINAIYTFTKAKKRLLEITGTIAWLLCLGGLVTGMIWAEIAWGRYWSWDPKETATLFLFLSLSGYMLALNEDMKRKVLLGFVVFNIIMVFVTLLVSPMMDSLHSHYYALYL